MKKPKENLGKTKPRNGEKRKNRKGKKLNAKKQKNRRTNVKKKEKQTWETTIKEIDKKEDSSRRSWAKPRLFDAHGCHMRFLLPSHPHSPLPRLTCASPFLSSPAKLLQATDFAPPELLRHRESLDPLPPLPPHDLPLVASRSPHPFACLHYPIRVQPVWLPSLLQDICGCTTQMRGCAWWEADQCGKKRYQRH